MTNLKILAIVLGSMSLSLLGCISCSWAQSSAEQPARTPDLSDGLPSKSQPLPIPRFVSLRASEVNLRTGPGIHYPVEWIYKRRGFPVEIVAEFDHWRKIRDWEGAQGWVHKSLLSDHRTALVISESAVLQKNATHASDILAKLERGVEVQILSCEKSWCRIEIHDFKGWLEKRDLWGVYPAEELR